MDNFWRKILFKRQMIKQSKCKFKNIHKDLVCLSFRQLPKLDYAVLMENQIAKNLYDEKAKDKNVDK